MLTRPVSTDELHLRDVEGSIDCILPNSRAVFFSKVERFPQVQATCPPRHAMSTHEPAHYSLTPKVTVVKFGSPNPPKPLIEDCREPLSADHADRAMKLIQKSSPRVTISQRARVNVSKAAKESPGPGSYDISSASNVISSARGKGFVRFHSPNSSPQIYSKKKESPGSFCNHYSKYNCSDISLLGPGEYHPEQYDGGLLKKSFHQSISRKHSDSRQYNITAPTQPAPSASRNQISKPQHISRSQARKIKKLILEISASPETDQHIPEGKSEAVPTRAEYHDEVTASSCIEKVEAPKESNKLPNSLQKMKSESKNKLSQRDVKVLLACLKKVEDNS